MSTDGPPRDPEAPAEQAVVERLGVAAPNQTNTLSSNPRGLTPHWDCEEAEEGQELELRVEAPGLRRGTEVELFVYQLDEHDARHYWRLAEPLIALVENQEATCPWLAEGGGVLPEIGDDAEPRDQEIVPALLPEFYLHARADGLSGDSEKLLLKRKLSLSVVGVLGEEADGKTFEVLTGTGELLSGTVSGGKAELEELPVGPYLLRIQDSEFAFSYVPPSEPEDDQAAEAEAEAENGASG